MALIQDVAMQQRALSDLRRVRVNKDAWDDEERRKLDEQRLSELEDSGREVLQTLTDVSRLAAEADQQLNR